MSDGWGEEEPWGRRAAGIGGVEWEGEAGGAGFSPEADLAVRASWTVPSGVAGARGARAWVAPPRIRRVSRSTADLVRRGAPSRAFPLGPVVVGVHGEAGGQGGSQMP